MPRNNNVEVEADEDFGRIPEGADLEPLATAVIKKAVEDLQNALGRDFESAKEFLCVPNEDLSFWCNVADFSPVAVVERCSKMLPTILAARQEREAARRKAIFTPTHVPA